MLWGDEWLLSIVDKSEAHDGWRCYVIDLEEDWQLSLQRGWHGVALGGVGVGRCGHW